MPAAGQMLGRDHAALPGQTLTALFAAAPGLLDGCRQVVLTGEGLETTLQTVSSGVSPLVLKAMPLNGGFTLCLSPAEATARPSLPCGGGDCVQRGASPASTLLGLLDRLAGTGLSAEQAALVAAARQAAGMAQERERLAPLCSACPQPPAVPPVPAPLPAASPDHRLDHLASWAQHRGGRLLVVDDSPTNRMVTGAVLGKAGFTVQLAASGEEAVRMVAEAADPPEAVLMDIAMPGMDGMAATAAIRALPGGRGRLPIIAVTAHADPEDRERCLEAGLDDYLPKPVVKVELLAALERWLTP